MRLAPITVKAATKRVREWHRHLPELQGGLFAVQLVDGSGACIGVGIVGNPPRGMVGDTTRGSRPPVSRVANSADGRTDK